MTFIPQDIGQALLIDRLYWAENFFYDRTVPVEQAGKNVANSVFSTLYEVEGAFDEAFAREGLTTTHQRRA